MRHRIKLMVLMSMLAVIATCTSIQAQEMLLNDNGQLVEVTGLVGTFPEGAGRNFVFENPEMIPYSGGIANMMKGLVDHPGQGGLDNIAGCSENHPKGWIAFCGPIKTSTSEAPGVVTVTCVNTNSKVCILAHNPKASN